MPAHLYIAPAAGGKTTYLVERAHALAARPEATVRVVVPTHLQARAWQRRLAEQGGSLGVRVGTFDTLYHQILREAGQVYTRLSDPVQYRLIRRIVDDLKLAHYAPLIDRPGFIHILVDMIGELKAARIWPETFTEAVAALGDEPRLGELARIYSAYQESLQEQRWTDRAGLGWLAVEALDQQTPKLARDWPLVVIDGFDNTFDRRPDNPDIKEALGSLYWDGNLLCIKAETCYVEIEMKKMLEELKQSEAL